MSGHLLHNNVGMGIVVRTTGETRLAVSWLFIAAAIRLGCSLVCGILVPDQGLNPNRLHYTGDS